MRGGLLCGAVLLTAVCGAQAQMRTLRPGDALQRKDMKAAALPATEGIAATVSARLTQVGAAPEGRLTLRIGAEYVTPGRPKWMQVPERITIAIPLASTAEAYGESRECHVSREGVRTFTYTAGLDEQNYMAFTSGNKPRDFRFLVNKYLCRALAAAYTCKSGFSRNVEAMPSKDMRYWQVGTDADVQLESKNVDMRAEVTPVKLTGERRSFDYAQCEKIAPSNGLCCVAGRTTEWHCGGTPAGAGWHQVSGSCFHRETGGSCKEPATQAGTANGKAR